MGTRVKIGKFTVPKISFDAKDYIDMILWKDIKITDSSMIKHISNDSLYIFIKESTRLKYYG